MKHWIAKAPTLIWTIACCVAMYIHTEPSDVQDILIWSWLRFIGLALLGTLTLYGIYSLRHPSLLSVNNYLTYLLAVIVTALEVSFRVRPDLIPGEELILHAPKAIRKQYALSRGYMTDEVLVSEASNGLLYHFRPEESLKKYPYVQIDRHGYRNSPGSDTETLDCVLLGDSLTLALDATVDLGSLMRQQGYATRNLGMFGYAPQQYRDVYKQFIIDAHIQHRYVLIFLFAGNDVQDARNYQQVQSVKGDFREYLPQMKSVGTVDEHLPLMVSVVRGLPRYLKSHFVTNRDRVVRLPYRIIRAGELMPPPHLQIGSDDWMTFVQPLGEIIQMARSHGAIPMVYLFPSAATIYSQYDVTLHRYDTYYQIMSDALRGYLAKESVAFSDLQDRLRTELRQQFIFAHENDYHLNSIGVEKVSDEVLNSLAHVARM